MVTVGVDDDDDYGDAFRGAALVLFSEISDLRILLSESSVFLFLSLSLSLPLCFYFLLVSLSFISICGLNFENGDNST